MPKLLQINVTANWGSTGKIAEQINLAAQARGWETYIAYGRMANDSASTLIKVGTRCDQLWHGVESRLLDRHGLASRRSTRQLVRKIDELRPDVIHLHNIHGYYLNYRILFDYLKQAGIPVVWTLHDCWAFTGHCSHFVTAGCERWKTQCHDCPLLSDYPKAIFVDRSYKNYKEKKSLFTGIDLSVVTVSEWLKRMAKDSFLGKSNTITCVSNGIDISLFKPANDNIFNAKFNIPNSSHVLMGVSSLWDSKKGLEDFVELRKLLSPDYVIVLVGLSRSQIQEMPHGIVGIERTENLDELVSMYSSSDVVLSLSRAETFGLTIVEGFACGTPGIVYNNTALPELITNETGLVVEQRNVAMVAAAVETIISKGKGFYSKACRERAERMFDKNRCFEKYVKLYEGLVKQG